MATAAEGACMGRAEEVAMGGAATMTEEEAWAAA